MITVLVVDNRPWVRRGLRMRLSLEPDMTVVGEAFDVETALEVVRELRPDVVVADIEMPGVDGIAAASSLQALAPHCAVVILSLREDPGIRTRVMAAGAAAFVVKRGAGEALPEAVRQAAAHRAQKL